MIEDQHNNTKTRSPFSAIEHNVSSRLARYIANDSERLFYHVLITTASLISQGVVNNCEGVSRYWGRGSQKKAAGLIRLFSLCLLAQCRRWLTNTEGEPLPIPWDRTAEKLLHVLGQDQTSGITDFNQIDTQLNYDLTHSPHMVHMGAILLAKAVEACGHKCVDWELVKFPVKSTEKLTQSGAVIDPEPIRGVHDIQALWQVYTSGLEAMNQNFNTSAGDGN